MTDKKQAALKALRALSKGWADKDTGTPFCKKCGCPSNMHKVVPGTKVTYFADGSHQYPPYNCNQCGKRCVHPKGTSPWFIGGKKKK